MLDLVYYVIFIFAIIQPLLRWCSRGIMFSLGYIYIPTTGRAVSGDECRTIISNHLSIIEPFYLMSIFCPAPVAAAENMHVPLFGTISKVCQRVHVMLVVIYTYILYIAH